MMSLLPSVSKAYAMIISDEGQRITSGSHVSGDTSEATVLFAGKGNYRNTYAEEKENYGRGGQNTSGKKKVN